MRFGPLRVLLTGPGKARAEQLLAAASIGAFVGWSANAYVQQRPQVVGAPPSSAVGCAALPDHQALQLGAPVSMSVLSREAFVMAFDWRTRNPLWVCQHLNRRSLQSKHQNQVSRSNVSFVADAAVPEPFRTDPNDFRNTRFDRGHLAPAADASTQKGLEETFLLTNISPQVGKGFNRTYWNRMEQFIRRLAYRFDDVYVISGPLYLASATPATASKKVVQYEVIGNQKDVAVPTHFFKSIICVKDSLVFGKQYSTASFILPNAPIGPDVPLEMFKVSLDHLEHKAGLLLWSNVINRHKIDDLCTGTSCVLQRLRTFKNTPDRTRVPAPVASSPS